MRSSPCCAALIAVALATPGVALAQSFGLDLTKEGPNLLPSLAILPVAGSGGDAARAPQIARGLFTIANASGRFSKVMPPNEAGDLLRRNNSVDAKCRDAQCLTDLSHALGVDRLLIAELDSGDLRLLVFDWGSLTSSQSGLPADELAPATLARQLEAAVEPLLQKIATPLGELTVTTNRDEAQIRLGSKLIGSGKSFQGAVPAGTLKVTVTAAGFEPYEETITVESTGKAEVEAELHPPAPVVAQSHVPLVEEEFDPRPRPKARSTPIWERRGFIAAAAGAAILGVGIAFGASAASVSSRMQDANRDGLMDVTRAEALGAQRSATAFNILGALGVAGIGAGVGYLMVFELKPPPRKQSLASSAPTVGVALNGSF